MEKLLTECRWSQERPLVANDLYFLRLNSLLVSVPHVVWRLFGDISGLASGVEAVYPRLDHSLYAAIVDRSASTQQVHMKRSCHSRVICEKGEDDKGHQKRVSRLWSRQIDHLEYFSSKEALRVCSQTQTGVLSNLLLNNIYI